MDVVRVAEPQYLPWSMQVRPDFVDSPKWGALVYGLRHALMAQQVFAQVKYGRLLDLFYNETPTGHVLCAIEPWMETVGDADTALSISCLLRYQDAFPEIGEDSITYNLNPCAMWNVHH